MQIVDSKVLVSLQNGLQELLAAFEALYDLEGLPFVFCYLSFLDQKNVEKTMG